MKKMTIIILAIVSMVACKKDEKTESETVVKEVKVEEAAKTALVEVGCYEYKSDGNIIQMEITEVNKNVIADLKIAYVEKDASLGKFVGTINGDKLLGTYTFNSEGKESLRELAFMIKENQLIEGYGDLNEDGTKFKDVKTIQYTSTMPLTKVDCTK
ncbi:hypothetical protein [Flavobacterium weaverense]|uniref:NlpE-like protein n=1 Tax=Flavobacterium weaverense TaxID=271156 RepID=A0A3L9ZJ11_9FLAO|nr:hypothetical protein [Flavobacterium weaverense]RMA72556.1 hypothetical protein BC961_2959 [Flavobacterium weaverense]